MFHIQVMRQMFNMLRIYTRNFSAACRILQSRRRLRWQNFFSGKFSAVAKKSADLDIWRRPGGLV